MRKSPVNFLLAIAIGLVLWVVTAVFYGGTFSESLILAESTPEDFHGNIRIFLGVAALAGIAIVCYWFYYGSLESVAGQLSKAKRVWWISFITLVIVSAALLFALIIGNLKEGILTKDWLIMYLLFSAHTWIFYWVCTFLMSPRTVQYIPLFK